MRPVGKSLLIILPIVVGLGLAIFFVGSFALRTWRTRAVLAHGVRAEARVLNLEDTGTRVNYQPLIAITVEVMPANKPPYRAVVKKVLTMADTSEFQHGAIIQVKYEPAHPDRVAIVTPVQ